VVEPVHLGPDIGRPWPADDRKVGPLDARLARAMASREPFLQLRPTRLCKRSRAASFVDAPRSFGWGARLVVEPVAALGDGA
jgi:hypothetical protein